MDESLERVLFSVFENESKDKVKVEKVGKAYNFMSIRKELTAFIVQSKIQGKENRRNKEKVEKVMEKEGKGGRTKGFL